MFPNDLRLEFRLKFKFSKISAYKQIQAVRVDGKDIDIVNYARRSQGTEVGCCESKDSSDTCQTDACKSNKCENNATCVPSKYAGFTCDCKGNKAASWTGRYCQTKGIILNESHQFTDLRL